METAQQTTSSGASTGNPQDISAQSGSLQNASPQSIEQIRALDQSSQALQVSGVDQEVSLNDIALTTSTEVPAAQQTSNTTHMLLYTGVGLVIILFVAFLLYGLFKPQHTK